MVRLLSRGYCVVSEREEVKGKGIEFLVVCCCCKIKEEVFGVCVKRNYKGCCGLMLNL